MQQEKKYPIGGYAPGNYQCHCGTCGGGFKGDKRAHQCEPCAINDKQTFDALAPSEQQDLMQRNANIINEVFAHGVNSNDFIQSGGLWKARALAAEKALEERKGAVWVKASTWPQDHNIVHWRRVEDKKPLLIVGRNFQDNIIAQFGRVYTPDELEWLDVRPNEQPVEQKENEAIAFAEFIRTYCPQIYDHWMHQGKSYTTQQLFNEYKKQNKQ
jgi:hypothetical protein